MQTIPQLPAKDLDDTIDFYLKLGFSLGRKYEEPTPYLIMFYKKAEIHFWPDKELVPASSNFSCYIRFEDKNEFDDIFERWSEAGLPGADIPRLTGKELRPWGMYEFYLVDLNGNLISCGIDGALYGLLNPAVNC